MALRKTGTVGRARRSSTSDIVRPTFSVRNPTIKFIGRGEAATRYATTTVFWPRGWFPFGSTACLRTTNTTANGVSSGTQIRTQIDSHTLWPDNSVAISIITAEVPRLNNNETLSCSLEIGASHPSPGTDLVWNTVASGKTASVSMTPTGQSTVTVDLMANLDAAYWRQGPLVVERRCTRDTLSAPMPASSRLTADVAIYADNTITVDPAICNDVVFAGGTTNTWVGVATVSINGSVKFNSSTNNIYFNAHNLFKRLCRLCSSSATKPPAVYTDMTVARDAGILPCYDFGLIPATNIEDNWNSQKAAAGTAWDSPYYQRLTTQYFPMTGGRADIGYLPDWYSVYVIQPNLDRYDIVTDMGETGLGIPLYPYDRATNSALMCINSRLERWWDVRDPLWTTPFEGGVTVVWASGVAVNKNDQRYYGLYLYQAATAGTTGATPPTHTSGTVSDGGVSWIYLGYNNGGWDVDTAHKANFCFAPFMVTGRRVFLDGMQGEAAGGIARFWPYTGSGAGRENGGTVISGLSCYLMGTVAQSRDSAWTIRDVVLAAFCTPNTGGAASFYSAIKTHLSEVIIGTFTRAYSLRSGLIAAYGDYAGFIDGFYGYGTGDEFFAPWQTDYFVLGAVRAYLLGFDAAGDYLTFMTDYWLGNRCRTTTSAGDWYPANGYNYNVPRRVSPGGATINGWTNLKANMISRDGYYVTSGWGSAQEGNYGVLASQSFVDLIQIFPQRPWLVTQFNWLNNIAPDLNGIGSPVRFLDAGTMRGDPKESMMPRGQTRGP